MPMNRVQFQKNMSVPSFMQDYGTEEQCAQADCNTLAIGVRPFLPGNDLPRSMQTARPS